MYDTPTVGGDLLHLITAGMYESPLVVFREFIQNAADALESNGFDGLVSVNIDPIESQILIRDNGIGISNANVVQRLVNVGCSPKDPTNDRGFRGIGRLSALAFADTVHFTTRSENTEYPMRITWDGRKLRSLDLSGFNVHSAIEECTDISIIHDGDWPDHFFEVDIEHVHRHAAPTILNPECVQKYLCEVAPVPFRSGFPLAKDISSYLSQYTDVLYMDIRINDSQQLKRPFTEVIALTDRVAVDFDSLETVVIPKIDSEEPAAILWLAHTHYRGSIPVQLGIRGLRARKGNLQLGTDRIFEHLFHEPRFNGWCVGEVHILDGRIVPNGRRDYFEAGPHLRNLENHIGATAEVISKRCRQASSQRNKVRSISTAINKIKNSTQLARSGYLPRKDAEAIVLRQREMFEDFRSTLEQIQTVGSEELWEHMADCDRLLNDIESQLDTRLEDFSTESLTMLHSVFCTIAETLPPDTALDLIETIVARVENSEKTVATSDSN